MKRESEEDSEKERERKVGKKGVSTFRVCVPLTPARNITFHTALSLLKTLLLENCEKLKKKVYPATTGI